MFCCQTFFHSANSCHLPPKCVKCAGNHSSQICPKKAESKCTCANCGGDHPASYRGCPKFPKPKPKPTLRSFPSKPVNCNTSYASHFQLKNDDFPKLPSNTKNVKFSSNNPVNFDPSNPPVEGEDNKRDDWLEFIDLLVRFERNGYHRDFLLTSLQNALPKLRDSKTIIDRISIFYECICELAKQNQK